MIWGGFVEHPSQTKNDQIRSNDCCKCDHEQELNSRKTNNVDFPTSNLFGCVFHFKSSPEWCSDFSSTCHVVHSLLCRPLKSRTLVNFTKIFSKVCLSLNLNFKSGCAEILLDNLGYKCFTNCHNFCRFLPNSVCLKKLWKKTL